jgi:rhamnosyltransferase
MKSHRTSRAEFAIGFVLFHPEESLLKRIDQMVVLGFQVYVFDNSPFSASFSSAIQINPEISYLTAGKNVGLGYSLSVLCATAYANGYERLLFLDQDTLISNQTLEFIEAYPHSLQPDILKQYAALIFSGHPESDQSVLEVSLAISSGSLFNLSVLKQIGWHNEKYFVDCVDYEFCIRARRCGFKIGLIGNTPDFDHVSGQPDQTIKLFGKKLLVRRYSATRIKDALGAYLNLIFSGLFQNKPSDTYDLARSMVIYIFGQLTSRFIQGKSWK